MPRYDYTCPGCGWAGERIVSVATRDAQSCDQMVLRIVMEPTSYFEDDPPPLPSPDETNGKRIHVPCGEKLVRTEISQVSPHQHAFVTGAVLKNGAVVPGRFGTTAPLKRRTKLSWMGDI